jgi:hypothetical protein
MSNDSKQTHKKGLSGLSILPNTGDRLPRVTAEADRDRVVATKRLVDFAMNFRDRLIGNCKLNIRLERRRLSRGASVDGRLDASALIVFTCERTVARWFAVFTCFGYDWTACSRSALGTGGLWPPCVLRIGSIELNYLGGFVASQECRADSPSEAATRNPTENLARRYGEKQKDFEE